jgi:arginyl-tRNA synthetase
MQCIQEGLVQTFTEAIEAAFPDVPDVGVPVVPSSKFGDYQCNAAMQLSQLLKAQGIISVPSGECETTENSKTVGSLVVCFFSQSMMMVQHYTI